MKCSPTYSLLWEIWRLNRHLIGAVIALTVAGRLVDFFERAGATDAGGAGMSPMVGLLWMGSFMLLFAAFSYTESTDSHAVGRFPHRLFVVPVSSLRLVTIPVLTGIASIELLYLIWLGPLSRGGSTAPAFIAVLLAASMVFYQACLWTLDRIGPLRILVIGAVGLVLVGIGMLPSLPPSPPPPWRSEIALGLPVAAAAIGAFFLAVRHVGNLRCGAARPARRLDPLVASVAARVPISRRTFGSPDAAHFWFEWRCSGLVLPLLVGGVLLLVVAPLSWIGRHDASRTLELLLGTLAAPVVLAIPLGFGFGKPTFWSEDLSLPAFVAVRPLADDDLVATKLKVAVASVVVSWVLVLLFLGCWLSLWASPDAIGRFAAQLRGLGSNATVFGMAVLAVIGAMFLTWRFLVSRVWIGLSGSRRLFSASVMSVSLIAIVGVGFAGFADWFLEWFVADPRRVAAVVWIGMIAVAAKYGLAFYSWRGVSVRYVRQYLMMWAAGTACFVALAVFSWGVMPTYIVRDVYRLQQLAVLAAFLAVPLGRMGLAPALLARNRHR